MNALNPSGKQANDFFNRIVAYAVANKVKNPLFPLDKEAAEKQKEWLNDAMGQLITMILNRDSKIPSTVSTELQSDLTKLKTAWGIADGKTAEETSAEIVAKAAELTGNIIT